MFLVFNSTKLARKKQLANRNKLFEIQNNDKRSRCVKGEIEQYVSDCDGLSRTKPGSRRTMHAVRQRVSKY